MVEYLEVIQGKSPGDQEFRTSSKFPLATF